MNIPHGVRRSDSPFLPPPPAFSVRSPLLLCPLHLGATSFLLPLAAVMWGPFCLGGVLFLVAPPFFLHVLFLCGPTWVMLSLPSFVLCVVFRSLSGFTVWALAEGRQPSKPTWVSVQDVVLNSLDRPRNQVNHSQSSATFTHTQATRRDVLLMSLWFLLVCHALTQK